MLIEAYSEIDAVIDYIHGNLYDPLPLTRLAGHVAYSPSHFSRMFKERTGLSPLYYVSSYRLQKAKELLIRTNMTVRDIGLEIGQQSLGTFTTRFTERVGVTPSEFRLSAQLAEAPLLNLRRLGAWNDPRHHQVVRGPHYTVEGSAEAEVPFEGVILIGLFAKPIPEGLPLHGTLLPGPGPFTLTGVKPGTYYLMATSVSWEMKASDFLLPYHTLRTRSREPVRVGPGLPTPYRRVVLHPPRPDDPPILVSIPLLMNRFLKSVEQNGNR